MKQGEATRSVTEVKTEPKPQVINPAWAGQYGNAVDPKAVEHMHAGRGFKSPPIGSTTHQCGSQGRR
jgi:hypothetical protein